MKTLRAQIRFLLTLVVFTLAAGAWAAHSILTRSFALEGELREFQNRSLTLTQAKKERHALARETAAYLDSQIQYQRHLFKFVSGLTLAMTALFLITFLFYLNRRVLRRIDELNQQMTDFFKNRVHCNFAVPLPDEMGQLQSTFHLFALKMKDSVRELQDLDTAKSEFVSIASHELRTPMTSIKGSLSLLSSGVLAPLDPATLNLVRIAENESDRLIRLINELLDLAKIEARQFPLALRWVPLDDLLTQAADGLAGLQQTTGVPIVIEPVDSFKIYVDPDRIHQVLTNLLSNALKVSGRGQQVTLSCRVEKAQLKIEVRDQGCGIAPEDRERIFQKFRQASAGRGGSSGGTGLGLSIAKALVEEHGGRIGVKSEPERGSVFYFTLPFRPALDSPGSQERAS